MRRKASARRARRKQRPANTGFFSKPENVFTVLGGALLLYILYENRDAVDALSAEGQAKYQEYQKDPS